MMYIPNRVPESLLIVSGTGALRVISSYFRSVLKEESQEGLTPPLNTGKRTDGCFYNNNVDI